MRLITVSTCSLQQWSLAWEENRRRILNAVSVAKEQGSSLLVTPELSVSGYSCEDHFLEPETQDIALEVLATIIADPICEGILIDVGLPVLHHGVLFNARCLFKDHKILLFRCKQDLANDDLFRETRWFAPWDASRQHEKYVLSKELRAVTGQDRVPIGAFCIEADDCSLAAESCEELFTPKSPHISMGLNGIEILTNSSGSHHSLRKLDTRIELIVNATKKNGGVYIYSNQIGIDGQPRMMFDGSSMIVINGEVKAITSQFSLSDETVSAVVDLDEVTSHRSGSARRMQAIKEPPYPSIPLNASLTSKGEEIDPSIKLSPSIDVNYLAPEAEIALGPAAWLWSYLVKSRQSGFFLPLSGGIDSASTAVIVYNMCRMVAQNVKEGNQDVIQDLRRTCGEADGSSWLPEDPKEICNRLFHTCFMGSENSSKETRDRARELAESIGSFHFNADIDLIVAGFTTLFRKLWGFDLRYKVNGGRDAENIALQNIQARSRMVLSYLLAQTLTLVRKRSSGGTLLVLGSANVDETLRGYYTKYVSQFLRRLLYFHRCIKNSMSYAATLTLRLFLGLQLCRREPN